MSKTELVIFKPEKKHMDFDLKIKLKWQKAIRNWFNEMSVTANLTGNQKLMTLQ